LSSAGRMNGTSHPRSRAIAAAASSSVVIMSRSNTPDARAASIVYAISGLPASSFVFFPGMPLDPARAVTTPATIGFGTRSDPDGRRGHAAREPHDVRRGEFPERVAGVDDRDAAVDERLPVEGRMIRADDDAVGPAAERVRLRHCVQQVRAFLERGHPGIAVGDLGAAPNDPLHNAQPRPPAHLPPLPLAP